MMYSIMCMMSLGSSAKTVKVEDDEESSLGYARASPSVEAPVKVRGSDSLYYYYYCDDDDCTLQASRRPTLMRMSRPTPADFVTASSAAAG